MIHTGAHETVARSRPLPVSFRIGIRPKPGNSSITMSTWMTESGLGSGSFVGLSGRWPLLKEEAGIMGAIPPNPWA